MQHLNLVLAIEERFGVLFEPEEMEEMKNIGAAAGMVDKKLRLAARSS
jgi:acyl carrier protein